MNKKLLIHLFLAVLFGAAAIVIKIENPYLMAFAVSCASCLYAAAMVYSWNRMYKTWVPKGKHTFYQRSKLKAFPGDGDPTKSGYYHTDNSKFVF